MTGSVKASVYLTLQTPILLFSSAEVFSCHQGISIDNTDIVLKERSGPTIQRIILEVKTGYEN